jgi:isopropylmalate/homocitrate/citramalate synthase
MSSPTNTPWKTDRWFVSLWNCSPEVTAGLHFSIKIQFGHGITSTVIAPAAGVEVIQTTVTGVGERVGNVPLEETALSPMTQYGIDLGVGYSKLCELSDFVLSPEGQHWPNRRVVGKQLHWVEPGIITS